MSIDQVTITQYSDNIDYCRVYNGSTYTDCDAEAVSIGGTPFTLWQDNDDYVYVGKDETFAYVGFRVATAGVGYGTFTLEYWDGAAWSTLTALFNNTTSFSESGYIAWSIPGDWAETTVDSTEAYWVRVIQDEASPATPATAYHLMRNITLDPPLHVLGPEFEYPRTYRDINGVVRNKDLTYAGPSRLTIEITQIACTFANMQLFNDWQYYRNDLYIEDEAVTSPIEIGEDSYYRIMEGKLVGAPTNMKAAGKMRLAPAGYYPLVFEIDTVVTQSSLLGLSL